MQPSVVRRIELMGRTELVLRGSSPLGDRTRTFSRISCSRNGERYFYGGAGFAYLYWSVETGLLGAVRNTAPGEIVRGKFNSDLVAR